MKEGLKYLLSVIIVAMIAFFIDISTSNVDVTIGTRTILDATGEKTTSIQVIYPLWFQIAGLIKNFLYGLAAAIFITVFIANKLQKSQSDKRQTELEALNSAVSLNVFDSLFKTIIPAEIFKAIKQDVIENKVIRREAKWIYDFSIKQNKIVCRQTTRYELHNVSQNQVSDPVKLELDSVGGEDYRIILAECLSNSGEILVHYDNGDEATKKNVHIEKNGGRMSVSYTVGIPPESHVEYKTVFERSFSGDVVDAQFTKVPVINADIIVNYPTGYDFDISPVMSTKPRLITHNPQQKIYRVDGGVLPFQGFMFYLVRSKLPS